MDASRIQARAVAKVFAACSDADARRKELIEEYRTKGVPRNPFVNAGALIVVDTLVEQLGDDAQADAVAPAAALAVFALAGMMAALLPASRAMTEDPVRALRHE